jgi:predicted MFS family arabinose efflux permease
MGRLVYSIGIRPVMILSQCITASGPLFFLLATPEYPWFVAGAFGVWIMYAGLNVALDNLKLTLAPADNNAPFVAVYHAVADLANGATTIFGGWVLDHIGATDPEAGPLYVKLFVVGFVARMLAVPLLVWLREPSEARRM